jgi:hypothetical protein
MFTCTNERPLDFAIHLARIEPFVTEKHVLSELVQCVGDNDAVNVYAGA